MRTRHLVSLVIAACVALAVWAVVRGRAEQSAGVSERRAVFAASELPLEQVSRVKLERAGAPTLVFERTADGWQQTEPYPHPGDAAAIREVIDAAAALEQSRAVDIQGLDPSARKAIGLDPPVAVLTLGWAGGEQALELGARTVAGRAWVRRRGAANDDHPAASVDAVLHDLAVDGDPRQWRSLALYDPRVGEAERVHLLLGGTGEVPWVFERADARWRFVSPISTRADSEAVRGYIEAIARAQADACAADQPDDMAAFGLAKPAFRVAVDRAGGGAQATIDIGSPVVQGAQERFGRVDGRPVVLQVGAKALAALFPPPTVFVDPRGSDVVPADVRAISFAPAPGVSEQPFTLERVRDAWVLRVGDETAPVVAANVDAVRRLLAQLCEARAAAIAFNALPDDLLLGEWTLRGEGGAQLASVRVAREMQGRWALDSKDGVLRVFPEGFNVRTDAAAYAGAP